MVDNHITNFGQAHNIAVNEDTARVYVVGAWNGVTIPGCEDVDGGPIAFDVSDLANPQVAGCYGGDSYTHDIQCVIYAGPDADYTDREICVASNEDTVTVLDVTDGLAYQSNYTSGLRVNDDTVVAGTWGDYPYFDSGTVVVTGYRGGLVRA